MDAEPVECSWIGSRTATQSQAATIPVPHDSVVRKAFSGRARRCWIARSASPHPPRHASAPLQLLDDVYDIRPAQEPLGHRGVGTTMIYAHVFNHGGRALMSPLDPTR